MNTLSDNKLEELGCNTLRGEFTNRTQFAPRMNAGADSVLVEDWLFIDADASISQGGISPFVGGGEDTLNRRGSANTTYRYSISPYVSRRLKDTAELNLRYTWDEQYNSTDLVGDSQQQTVAFTLGSVAGATDISWGLEADYDKLKYGNRPAGAGTGTLTSDSELKSAQLNLGYQMNRAWQLNGHYGEERNDFVSISNEIDGDYWDVGLRWTPNARTTVEAGTGDRFFGDTPRFSINYRHKHSVFTASYRKDLTYDRNIRTLGDNTLAFENEFGQPIDPSTGQPLTTSQNSSTLSNSPILDERFALAYAYEGRRSTLRLSATHSDQTRAEDGQDSTFRNASIDLDRSLSRQLTLSGRLSWNEQDPRGPRSELIVKSEEWRATLGVQRSYSENLTLSLFYDYVDRQSDRAIDEYQENRIALTLRFNL